MVFLPADEVGGDAAGDFRLLAALVIRAEQEAVQVERNQREHFLAPLFHDLRLFLERAVDFAVHPPTGQRRPGGTEQDLVPKPDAPVNALVQIVAGQQLMLSSQQRNRPTKPPRAYIYALRHPSPEHL